MFLLPAPPPLPFFAAEPPARPTLRLTLRHDYSVEGAATVRGAMSVEQRALAVVAPSRRTSTMNHCAARHPV